VQFHTHSAGVLAVWREGDSLMMDFPARPPNKIVAPPGIAEALGATPAEVLAARDYLAVFARASDVMALTPDFGKLAALDCFAVIATAPGDGDADFVSRFFAPKQGVDEDPVTGSAHCTLIPYWAARLGKEQLKARQISARGGELFCAIKDNRVAIGGKVTLYLEGSITV
jgi:predicted PhzF superfamily epimerase YddE/YHI9